jgi:hypothetical protein
MDAATYTSHLFSKNHPWRQLGATWRNHIDAQGWYLIRIRRSHHHFAISMGDDKQAWGVEVPDIPGYFSAGDDQDNAMAMAPIPAQSYRSRHQSGLCGLHLGRG